MFKVIPSLLNKEDSKIQYEHYKLLKFTPGFDKEASQSESISNNKRMAYPNE